MKTKKRKSIRKNSYITEEYLNKRIDRLIDYIDMRFESIETFQDEFKEFKGSVLKSLDWLVGAFKKFDEEHTILTGRYSDINKTIDNHEERIITLERKKVTAN